MQKMKAIDTLHITAVSDQPIRPDETFEVSEADAKSLEDRGLAKRVGAAKAEPAPTNKAEPAPTNKATDATATKTRKTPAKTARQ